MPHQLTPKQQAIIIEAQRIEGESQHFQQQLSLIDEHIKDLRAFEEALVSLSKENSTELLAPLGRGVFLKTARFPKEKLFVEVGA
ncbi:MAG: hypothetical protein ABIH92_03815, partial [Nanoarchaeota archaeon]